MKESFATNVKTIYLSIVFCIDNKNLSPWLYTDVGFSDLRTSYLILHQ